MLTVREAMQRCTINQVRIKRTGFGGEWLVTLIEWTAKQRDAMGYYTDDLEDAVLTGAKLRHNAA